MRTVPIPDEIVWEGARRAVIAAPDGDLTNPKIAPVEAVVDVSESLGMTRYSVRCALEPGDLDKLAGGGHVWVSFYGGMPVFSIDVTGPPGRSGQASPEAGLPGSREGGHQ